MQLYPGDIIEISENLHLEVNDFDFETKILEGSQVVYHEDGDFFTRGSNRDIELKLDFLFKKVISLNGRFITL